MTTNLQTGTPRIGNFTTSQVAKLRRRPARLDIYMYIYIYIFWDHFREGEKKQEEMWDLVRTEWAAAAGAALFPGSTSEETASAVRRRGAGFLPGLREAEAGSGSGGL